MVDATYENTCALVLALYYLCYIIYLVTSSKYVFNSYVMQNGKQYCAERNAA